MRLVLVSLLALTCLGTAVAGQTIIVTGKKVTYTRQRPQMEYKKTFTVNYPLVKGPSPKIAKQIQRSLNYETLFNFKIREELGEIQWLEEADYEVLYNENGLLCVRLFISGSGAYPSGSTKNVIVDVSSGRKLGATDVFDDHPALASLIEKAQQRAVAEAIDVIKKDPENSDLDTEELFSRARFTIKDLNGFSIDGNGVTFVYDYGFPHVIRALEPDGEFQFSWQQMKPFIKRNGAFAQFAR